MSAMNWSRTAASASAGANWCSLHQLKKRDTRQRSSFVGNDRDSSCQLASTDIPRMGSVDTRKPAPQAALGQREGVSGGASRVRRAAEPRSAGRFGLSSPCWPISAHGSPSAPPASSLRSRQAAAMGGPRRRSIRRRIAANSARGTATSASWNTT